MTYDIDHHVAVFRRGADELLVESELRTKLARGKPLNVKEGFDPQGVLGPGRMWAGV